MEDHVLIFGFMTPALFISNLLAFFSLAVFIYGFLSLKKSSKTDCMSYLSSFSLAFLFFALSNLGAYFSVILAAALAGQVNVWLYDLYVNLPGYIFSAAALVFFFIGVRQAKSQRNA